MCLWVYTFVYVCVCRSTHSLLCHIVFLFLFPVEFWVSDLPGNTLEQPKPALNRNPYAIVGHSMQMVCKYRNVSEDDFCSERNTTNLIVHAYSDSGYVWPSKTAVDNNIVILNRTKCSLTVEFRNMTTDFQGPYRCEDTENEGKFVPRNIYVGGMYYDGHFT